MSDICADQDKRTEDNKKVNHVYEEGPSHYKILKGEHKILLSENKGVDLLIKQIHERDGNTVSPHILRKLRNHFYFPRTEHHAREYDWNCSTCLAKQDPITQTAGADIKFIGPVVKNKNLKILVTDQ